MTQPFACPQCDAPQQAHAGSVEFCFRCRFPLMLIAGKYRLEKLLAEGGQGAVYLARHIELELDPLRVIKIVKSELFEQLPNLSERFRREVQVTSALSQRCQHIVRIYDDFGEIPALGRFYVMEHLEGQALSELISDPDELPELPVCLHIFYQLCDAMRFAHREDIIHRDLKPDNLMLISFEDEPLFLKVLDFGIAWPSGEQSADAPRLTQGVVGTPEYMAPEQLTGKPVDARADLYAMGAILYEMLTGQTPHKLLGAGQEAFFELVMTRLKEDPPPPSEVRPDRNIHPAVEQVVMTLLRRPPHERYPRVEVLKAALREAEREVRRSRRTVLQDTAIDFDDQELSQAALQFGIELPVESPAGRVQTAGYGEPIDEGQAKGDGSASASPAALLPELVPIVEPSGPASAHSPTNPSAAAFSVTDEPTEIGAMPPEAQPSLAQIRDVAAMLADTPREANMSALLQEHLERDDELEHLTQPAAPLPSHEPHVDHGPGRETLPIDEDTLKGHEATALQETELPVFSEDEFDDETAISGVPDVDLWPQPSPAVAPVREEPSARDAHPAPTALPSFDDATKESPSFHLRPDDSRLPGLWWGWVVFGALVVLLAGGGLWWWLAS